MPRTSGDLDDDDLLAAMQAARRAVDRMRATLQNDGFNILHNIGRAAWQSIFHFHVHVVPRYEDDPLELPCARAGGPRRACTRRGSDQGLSLGFKR